MATYLDLIPKDLIYIILYKVNDDDITDITDIKNLVEFSADSTFWENRIRYKVGNLNLNLIPQWFYNYRGKSMEVVMENYNKLLFNYEESINLANSLSETGSYKITPKMVTNVEAYIHPENIFPGDYFNDDAPIILISRKGNNFQLKFTHTKDIHFLTHQQIIDLLTHIQCNGYYIF